MPLKGKERLYMVSEDEEKKLILGVFKHPVTNILN